MLLTRLVEYADAHPTATPPFYAVRRVRWQLDLDQDGRPVTGRLQDLADASDPLRRTGVQRAVPSVQRSGTAAKPMLAADTAEYVFGWTADASRAGKAADYHRLFREQVDAWAEATGDPAAVALEAFYAGGHRDSLPRPDGLGGGDLVVFRVGDGYVHDTVSAREHWVGVALGRKGSGRCGVCLVCGRHRDLLQTIPTLLPTRLVPGATQTSGVALVSLNKRTHGFDLAEQLVHSPICVECGLKAMSALEALLSSEQHSVTLPGQNARLAWWLTGTDADIDLTPLFSYKAVSDDDAREMLASILKGRRPGRQGEADLDRFCSVVVGGNVSRIVVRDWVEMPLKRLRDNLQAWFDDHEVIDSWTQQRAHFGVGALSRTLGRWLPGRGAERGNYARFGQSGEDRPEAAYATLVGCGLFGRPLPPYVLSHVVRRVRTDGRRHDPARAALLRVGLVRHPTDQTWEKIMPSLEDNTWLTDPAFLAGQVFAVLERLQSAATEARGDKEKINATFADKHFSRAVTNPAVSINQGRRDAQAWLKRLRRDRPSWGGYYERLLTERFAALAEAGTIPQRNTVAQQSAFILGYHQQRAALFTKKDGTSEDQQPDLGGDPE